MGYRDAEPRKKRLFHVVIVYVDPKTREQAAEFRWIWALEGHLAEDAAVESAGISQDSVWASYVTCGEDFAEREALGEKKP